MKIYARAETVGAARLVTAKNDDVFLTLIAYSPLYRCKGLLVENTVLANCVI
jgi:hypothetical protein